MSEESAISSSERKTPWQVWAVAILPILWNGAGAEAIAKAVTGRLTAS